MSNDNVVQASVGALLSSLTPIRREAVKRITTELVTLRLPQETVDAVLAAVILGAAEAQYVDEGGATPPPRDSTVELLRSVFGRPRGDN